MINAFITPGLETAAGRNVLVNWMQRHVARQIALVSSIALLATFAGCQKSKTDAVSASRGKIDACTLITNEEVKTIQGSPIKDVKSSEQADGDEKKKESLREQEEEKGAPPKKIDGIGDSAYWTANRMGGALYVLKNDVFIRVSVGGPDNEEAKIKRSKALAEKALSRLKT